MEGLLVIAGVAMSACVLLFLYTRRTPKPEVKNPVATKSHSYNPQIWFCKICQKEYRLDLPYSEVPDGWMYPSVGAGYTFKRWECPRCKDWANVRPVGWSPRDLWPPK